MSMFDKVLSNLKEVKTEPKTTGDIAIESKKKVRMVLQLHVITCETHRLSPSCLFLECSTHRELCRKCSTGCLMRKLQYIKTFVLAMFHKFI